jgi:hypothetical protein
MKFGDIIDRAETPGWWKRVAERWVSLDYEHGFHLVCGTWFTCRGESISLQLQGGGFTDSERSYFVGNKRALLIESRRDGHLFLSRRGLVHRLISGRHTAVGDLADFQGASDEHTEIRT